MSNIEKFMKEIEAKVEADRQIAVEKKIEEEIDEFSRKKEYFLYTENILNELKMNISKLGDHCKRTILQHSVSGWWLIPKGWTLESLQNAVFLSEDGTWYRNKAGVRKFTIVECTIQEAARVIVNDFLPWKKTEIYIKSNALPPEEIIIKKGDHYLIHCFQMSGYTEYDYVQMVQEMVRNNYEEAIDMFFRLVLARFIVTDPIGKRQPFGGTQ